MSRVVASSFTIETLAQADGRRRVLEVHALDDGTSETYTYLPGSGVDPAYVLAERAAMIEARLAGESEAANG